MRLYLKSITLEVIRQITSIKRRWIGTLRTDNDVLLLPECSTYKVSLLLRDLGAVLVDVLVEHPLHLAPTRLKHCKTIYCTRP